MSGALLIGGAGFLGRNLQDALEARGCRTVVADPAVSTPSSERMALSLSDTEALERVLRADDGLDVVVHLASGLLPASDEAAFEREQQRVNRPSVDLIAACARLRRRFVLFSSGGTVYGDGGDEPIPENRPPMPKSRYGRSKVLLEQAVLHAHEHEGLDYLILRPSNPYGRYQRIDASQGLVAVAIGRAMSGQVLEIWGDGRAVRDYVDVRDLVAAVVDLILARVPNRTLNLSSGVGHSIDEVLGIVEHAVGRRITRIHKPPRSSDVRSVVLDPSALARLVAWAPRGLEQGVREFCDHLRAAPRA